MINQLPLHDAAFDGIVTSSKTTTLYFTRSDGTGCAVTLGEISHLQMNDFREGNIVILFKTISGEGPPLSIEFERLFGPETRVGYDEFLRSMLEAIKAGTLTLVEMQPAYGADLLAICRTVHFSEH